MQIIPATDNDVEDVPIQIDSDSEVLVNDIDTIPSYPTTPDDKSFLWQDARVLSCRLTRIPSWLDTTREAIKNGVPHSVTVGQNYTGWDVSMRTL